MQILDPIFSYGQTSNLEGSIPAIESEVQSYKEFTSLSDNSPDATIYSDIYYPNWLTNRWCIDPIEFISQIDMDDTADELSIVEASNFVATSLTQDANISYSLGSSTNNKYIYLRTSVNEQIRHLIATKLNKTKLRYEFNRRGIRVLVSSYSDAINVENLILKAESELLPAIIIYYAKSMEDAERRLSIILRDPELNLESLQDSGDRGSMASITNENQSTVYGIRGKYQGNSKEANQNIINEKKVYVIYKTDDIVNPYTISVEV
jgi:hypothetical protein